MNTLDIFRKDNNYPMSGLREMFMIFH